MNLSAIIITKNEENNIQSCIENLSFADEVIVIDNQSFDKTASIAKSMGADVYQMPGLDFSFLRNLGREKAKSDWRLYLDADEKVTDSLKTEIKSAISDSGGFSGYQIIRHNYFFNKSWPKKEKMLRLIRKDSLLGWQGQVHETPMIEGKIGILKSEMLHFTHKDLGSMLSKTNEWSEIEAFLRFKANHPQMAPWRFIRVMVTAFWKSYISQGGWIVGDTGLIESIYQAFSSFITYAKLWEMQVTHESSNS